MTAPAGPRRRVTVRFAGVLRNFRGLLVVPGPPCLLGELNAGRLPARLGSVAYRAYLFRMRGVVGVVVPPEVGADAGVQPGEWVEASVRLAAPRIDRRVPADVRAALVEQGLDVSIMSASDRRQSLLLIGESKNPAARQARIAALIAACAAGGATATPPDQPSISDIATGAT